MYVSSALTLTLSLFMLGEAARLYTLSFHRDVQHNDQITSEDFITEETVQLNVAVSKCASLCKNEGACSR